MARTPVVPATAPGAYTGALQALTFRAMDETDGNDFPATGRSFIIFRNDSTASQTVTITSVDDELGRQEHITDESVAAGEYAVFGPVAKEGWAQTDRKIYLDSSDPDMKVAVIEFPSSVFRP